ncbi:MAG: adenine phosphoribosyltransferase [Armatimonadetes bacterium]|nr:adenine phosphoribosyltransferase [Armatimonadota bacterium]
MSNLVDLRTAIRDIPDFPKKGILFKDITTLLKDPHAFRETVHQMTEACRGFGATHIVAIESRGYMFGGAVAYNLGLGFVPVRKPGKLPAETFSEDYELEYGTNTLELHRDALGRGDRALIVDDLIATGGSSLATARLVERGGAEVSGFGFVVELSFLNGRDQLSGYPVVSLITY